MPIGKKVTIDQIKLDYDYNNAMEKSYKLKTRFPGYKNLQKMLENVLKLDNNQHLYISSNKGSRLEYFLLDVLKDKEYNAYDWAYVYNFNQPDNPTLIQVEKGQGDLFKDKVEKCVIATLESCKKCFSSKEIKEVEKAIKEQVVKTVDDELAKMKSEANEIGFSTHISEKGIFFIPIINGKKISEADYDNLDLKEQEDIIRDLNIMEKKSIAVMKRVKKIKKESKNKVKAIKEHMIGDIIEENFAYIVGEEWYKNSIVEYITLLKKDLEKQLKKIFLEMNRNEIERFSELIDLEKIEKDNKYKFQVNLLEDKTKYPIPVIYGCKPSYYELFGKIEYINDGGVFTTDFTQIKGGLFHIANGGYLILDINDLIYSKMTWDKLKKCLMEKKIEFDPIREQLGALPVKTIMPEKIPLDLKVILIGEENIYHTLAELDSEFKEIFAYHLIVSEVIDVNEDNIASFLAYLNNKGLTVRGKKRIIEYAVGLTGNRRKITTKLSEIDKLIDYSRNFAKEEGASRIGLKHIKKGELELKEHCQPYYKVLEDMVTSEQLIIDVKGKKTGQINGLSVSKYTDFYLAFPIRITANTYAGEQGIFCLEKENKMCGRIFGKSINIINSYINQLLGKEKPLTINCSISFEQVYGDIEGDSATCASILAVLSSLSNIAIEQGIAVTGSVDQFGNIQPIGAVSHKIEGFYNICKLKGLTGKQGVVIPEQNIGEIILNDEITRMIERNRFHIFSVNKIEDAIPLLMGTTISKVKKNAYHNINQMQA